MSKIVAAAAIRASNDIVKRADEKLSAALQQFGPDQELRFPETAFFLPMACALLGAEVEKLSQAQEIVEYTKTLLSEEPTEALWLPYLADALDAGIATMLAEEVIMALRYLAGTEPQDGWHGFISDTVLRSLGIQLVDGRLPGFAAVVGAAPDVETAEYLIRELQKRSILTFLIGNHNGETVRDQLIEAGVLHESIIEDPASGWDTYIVPLGPDTESIIYALNWAIRGALTFGGRDKGDWKGCLDYTRSHIFAFGLGLGDIDDLKFASGAGAITMGAPVICDTEIPEILPTGVCTYEELVSELDHERIVQRCVDVRGVKVTVREVDVPVPVAPAFEGETVRRPDMHVEFGGKYSTCFEYLTMRDMDDIQDGKVEVIGPDIDTVEVGGAMPLAIYLEVAGRKMQEDFEGLLERRIHSTANYAHGIFHMGQRDLAWIRVSKDAFEAGWRLRHFGDVIIAELKAEMGVILDKVQATIISDQEAIDKLLPEAQEAYRHRDERMGAMTDESVDIFYSCALCQSYAPDHICVISPERLGLCGAYNWLDGKAAYEISPHGANQPVEKGFCLNEDMGEWDQINEFVKRESHGTVERVSLYSIMDAPMTSCGCFECILAMLPEANGFMIVNREYAGMTPLGMEFSTLAGAVGGGHQTPGFLGVGRRYVISRKFITGDGGLPRLVWMPKELKDDLIEGLTERGQELEMPDLPNQIATEEDAETIDELVEYLQKVGHPAPAMEALL